MQTRERIGRLFGFLLLSGLAACALAAERPSSVIGMALHATNATVEDSALLAHGVIFSGEAVQVLEGGSAVLSFPQKGQAVLAASTHARFTGANGNITARLFAGTLIVSRETNQLFVVKTSAYSIRPQGGGRTEFLVASLPGDKMVVEAQHGAVAITQTGSKEIYTLAQGQRAEIGDSAQGLPDQGKKPPNLAIGQLGASEGTTRDGKPLSPGDWVLNGDTISTGANGKALVRLWPANQVTLHENATATFTRPAERVWLKLDRGEVIAENASADSVLIQTSKFNIEPASGAASMISVKIEPDGSTLIESVVGPVTITETSSDRTYLLAAGQKTLVPANASGVPGLQPQAAAPAATPTPATGPPPAGVSGHSHHTYLIVGIAAGGGAAAAAAALAASGGGSTSPTASSVNP